jgi:hypothetical protein
MIAILKSLRTLFSYVIAVSFIISPFLPNGEIIGYLIAVFFLVQLPFIRQYEYCLSTWYVIDILACHCVHNTGIHRTISGYTGERIHKHKRFYYQSKVIDLIFGKEHCLREFKREQAKGYV